MTRPKTLTRPLPSRPGNRSPGPVRAWAGPLWAWLVVLLPVVVYALVWQYYAVNVPKWDDHALREYLYRSDQETTLSGKIYQLFKQHNEHRIVYDRMVAALDYRLFGKLSYVHLMVVGNLSLVGLLVVFGAMLLGAGKSRIALLPVSLLLFNLSHWENMFWGMAALQNFSVVFWVVLTVYLLSSTNLWGGALASAVLATLTSGNGLLVWPIGFVLLLLQTPDIAPRRSVGAVNRPARLLLIWAGVAALTITLYFIGFGKPPGNPPDRGSITGLLRGWLAFTGAAAEALSTGSPLSASVRLGGLMVLVTLGWAGWSLWTYGSGISKAIQRVFGPEITDPGAGNIIPPVVLFFWGCAAFILGTAAVVAWTRTGFGLDLMFTSRYKLYSLTLLALLYVYAVVALPNYAGRWVSVAVSVGGLLIAWLSYNAYVDETIWWRHYMLTSQFNWTYGTNRPVSRLDAVTKHYATPAPAFYDANPAVLYGAGQPARVPITITKTPAGFEVNESTLTVWDERDGRSFVVARSPKRTYLFPTRQHQNLSRRTRFWPASTFITGFSATIALTELDAGTYQLFILTVAADGELKLHPTGQTIVSVGQAEAPLKKNW